MARGRLSLQLRILEALSPVDNTDLYYLRFIESKLRDVRVDLIPDWRGQNGNA